MDHSKNLNAKIYNSSLSAWCLQGYTTEPQVKKATFIHKLSFFFFFFFDNLIVGVGGFETWMSPIENTKRCQTIELQGFWLCTSSSMHHVWE